MVKVSDGVRESAYQTAKITFNLGANLDWVAPFLITTGLGVACLCIAPGSVFLIIAGGIYIAKTKKSDPNASHEIELEKQEGAVTMQEFTVDSNAKTDLQEQNVLQNKFEDLKQPISVLQEKQDNTTREGVTINSENAAIIEKEKKIQKLQECADKKYSRAKITLLQCQYKKAIELFCQAKKDYKQLNKEYGVDTSNRIDKIKHKLVQVSNKLEQINIRSEPDTVLKATSEITEEPVSLEHVEPTITSTKQGFFQPPSGDSQKSTGLGPNGRTDKFGGLDFA